MGRPQLIRLAVFLILMSLSPVYGQQLAITEQNRSVILFPDGTWSYQDQEAADTSMPVGFQQTIVGESITGATYKVLGTGIENDTMFTCLEAINKSSQAIVTLNLERVVCSDLSCGSYFDGELIENDLNDLDVEVSKSSKKLKLYHNHVSLYPQEKQAIVLVSKRPVSGKGLRLTFDNVKIDFTIQVLSQSASEMRDNLRKSYGIEAYCLNEQETAKKLDEVSDENRQKASDRKKKIEKIFAKQRKKNLEDLSKYRKECSKWSGSVYCQMLQSTLENIEKLRNECEAAGGEGPSCRMLDLWQ